MKLNPILAGLLVSVLALPLQAQQINELNDEQIIEEFHSCVISSIPRHDDRNARPAKVAQAAVKACDAEARAAAKAARRGRDDADKFYEALKTGEYFVPAVMEDRSVQKDAEALIKSDGGEASAKALANQAQFLKSGDRQRAEHWVRVAQRITSMRLENR